jgi:protein CpxP
MKNSLKILLICLGTAASLLPALRADEAPPPPANPAPGGPEGPGGGGHNREKMQERLAQDLGLSADQQAKWKSIGRQEHEALKALRDDTSVPQEQKRGKMQEIRKNFEGQRRAMLTPGQQTKFDELVARMREKWKDRGGQNGPPPPPPAENK